jgi:hypothetical protein
MSERTDGVLTSLLLAFCDFALPVLDTFESPEAMEFFWYRHGWRLSLDDAALAQLNRVLPIAAIGQEAGQLADAVRGRSALDPDGGPSLDEVARLADAVTSLAEALATLDPSSLAGLPGPLADAATWEDLGEQLFDTLLEQYLQAYHPILYLVLLVSGCLRYDSVPAVPPARVAFVRAAIDWSQLQALLHDPVTALAHTYHWGDPAAPFDHERLLDAFGRVLQALHVETDLVNPSIQLEPGLPADAAAKVWTKADGLRATILHGAALHDHITYEVGFDLLPAGPVGGAAPTGLLLRPRLKGAAAYSIPLGASFVLTVTADASAGDVLGVSFFPGDTSLTGGEVTVGTAVEIATSSTDPWYLAGTAGSARIEAHSPSMQLSLEGTVDDPELRFTLGTATQSAGQAGCRVVIPMDGSDSFVQDSVGKDAIQFSFTPEVIWSSKTGFGFNGRPTPQIDLPLSIKVGSFTVRNAKISATDGPARTSQPSFALQVGIDVGGSIGPVTVVIQGLGFAVDLLPYSHQELLDLSPGSRRPALGNLDVDMRFAAPTGAGLAIDAGIVSGGGFLAHQDDEYSGALDLSIRDVAVKAYGLVQTVLPGGLRGYSFLAVISTEFSPAVQLPLGFSLDGVGGLIGVHRTISEDAVRAAVWAHHLDGLLFPKDPVASAPHLISAVEAYFPAAPGRYVFGPLAKIGWSADLVVGEVALILELPEPLKLLLIGEIQVEVPPKKPQLELHISFAGGIDFGQKLAFFDASLHNSRIASYPLSGDLAFRYGWGDQPVLALALGGFHPHFQPPATFPTLKRLAITISSSVAQLDAQAYLALTSNTLQFGARVELTAGTGGFNVHGWLGFDALCERDPLFFEFDLSAGVDLRHGTDVLASVHLDGQLTGPAPWHIVGEASLSLFFFDVTVHFNKTWGAPAGQFPVPDPRPVLFAALEDPSAWSGALPPAARAAISAAGAPADAGGAVLLDPAASLRIAQRAVPLGQSITRFGGTPLARTAEFSISVPAVFGAPGPPLSPTTEEFAPAQFFDFSDAEKLSLPSFSRFDAGVEIGAAAVDAGRSARTRAVITPLTYDTTIIDSPAVQRPGTRYIPGAATLLAMNGSVEGARPGLDRYGPAPGTPPRVTLPPDRWVVAGTADLGLRADIDSDGSKLGARLALERHLLANPGQAGQLQIVLAEEAT